MSATKTFETPRLEPGSSVSPASGYSSPLVRTPIGAAVQREQRDQLAGPARELALVAHHVHLRRADERVDPKLRVPRRAEEEQRREEVVEPAAVAGQHEDTLWVEGSPRDRARARGRWRPSRPDAARCAFRPPRPRRRPPARRSRSRPPRSRPRGRARARARGPCPRRSRAHPPVPRARSERREGSRLPPPPRLRSARLPPLALPRSGSAGRRRAHPSSQPGCPSSPLRSAHRSGERSRIVPVMPVLVVGTEVQTDRLAG